MPLPSRVVSNGTWNRSTNRFTSGPAPLRTAPKPTSATTGSPRSIASARTRATVSTWAGSGSTCGTRSRTSWWFSTSTPRSVRSSGTVRCTGPGLPESATCTRSSTTSEVLATWSRNTAFFVVASNTRRESGVPPSPEVSFSEPRPLHFRSAYPDTANTGHESLIAIANPDTRLNAPGPAVAKQKPSLPVNIE